MSETNINEDMIDCAEGAVSFAKRRYDVALDYRVESIMDVEDILDDLFKKTPKNFISRLFKKSLSEDEINTICSLFGGYIGEVYRRNKGGEWSFNEEFGTTGVKYENNWIFPIDKIYKRLSNGSEDNLNSYFRVIMDIDFMSKLGKKK